ncbi:MAG: DUF1559 domain-containing protein [Planctomycetota bacterium]|nr:MAG: DUF1559 domain-containing protein [Planctomycetota bacterium]
MADALPDRQFDESRTRCGNGSRRGAGFSLIDLLVSISVMAILLGLLSPTLGRVAETARRVKCQKKLADVGLALTMYAADHRDTLPPSDVADEVFAPARESARREPFQPSRLMELAHLDTGEPGDYDGLGRLVGDGYLADPSALYCPSHDGEHPIDHYAGAWMTLQGEIVINFHYRLFDGMAMLGRLDPAMTLVTDGMRSQADYNHRTGNNLLRADMSVDWYADKTQYITGILPVAETAPSAGLPLSTTWRVMDTGKTPDDDTTDRPAQAGVQMRSFNPVPDDFN